jgi:protein translocase SecG subunit
MLGGLELLYVIICGVLMFFVMIQNTLSNSMGGLSGESSSNTGGRVTILTKITSILAILFFIIAFSINYSNKTNQSKFETFSDMEVVEKTIKDDTK